MVVKSIVIDEEIAVDDGGDWQGGQSWVSMEMTQSVMMLIEWQR